MSFSFEDKMTTISELNIKFIEYAKNNDLEQVQKIIEQGANIDCDSTLLLFLLENEFYTILNYLVKAGAFIHQNNDEILVEAIKKEQYDLFYLLLEHGANLRTQNDICFFELCKKGNINLIHEYSEKVKFSLTKIGFEKSLKANQLDSIQYFIAQNVLICHDNHTLLHNILHLLAQYSNMQVIDWFKSKYVWNDNIIQDFLTLAIKYNRIDIFKSFSEYNLSFISYETLKPYLSDENYTPLLCHIIEFNKKHYSKDEIFYLILNCIFIDHPLPKEQIHPNYGTIGYSIEFYDSKLNSLFDHQYKLNQSLLDFLLTLHPQFNYYYFKSIASELWCLSWNFKDFISLSTCLINAGFNINQFHYSLCVLISSSSFDDTFTRLLSLLIANNFNIHQQNNELLCKAITNDRKEIVQLLLSYGANLQNAYEHASEKDKTFFTPYYLHHQFNEVLTMSEESSQPKI